MRVIERIYARLFNEMDEYHRDSLLELLRKLEVIEASE
jgi:hypothetical protein